MISANVCRWLSVRGRTYRTIITPEVSVAAAQALHTLSLVGGQYFTKKLLLQHLDENIPGAGIRGKEPTIKSVPQTDERRHSEALHGCTVLAVNEVLEEAYALVEHELITT